MSKTGNVVLIIDDDCSLKHSLSAPLIQASFTPIFSHYNTAIVTKLNRLEPETVILNTCDSTTLYQQIRQHPQGEHIPIILLTTHDDIAWATQTYRDTAMAFMLKPINPTLLTHRLQGLLHTRQLQLALKQSEQQLNKIKQLAYYDGLTQLSNYSTFKEQLNNAIANAKQQGNTINVLFLDLDNFKQINDTLGHTAGDQLLAIVAKRLRASLNCYDSLIHIARLSGDEFAILLPNNINHYNIKHIASLILKRLSQPILIAGKHFTISTSIGIAKYPHHGDTADRLLENADKAMYQAKASGKNTFCFSATTGAKNPTSPVETLP